MKNYEKPVVMVNEGLAEGVYAASGDCWSVNCYPVNPQHVVDGYKHFRVEFQHTDAVTHISTAVEIQLTFNYPIADASGEFSSSASGNVVTITRQAHANAYFQGDLVNILLQVKPEDVSIVDALACTGTSITCTKGVNVQGGID